MATRSLLPRFPTSSDPTTGRRWRWKLPIPRVAFAFCLTLVGFILCVYGLSTSSLAPGAAGLLCFLPGAYASYVYIRIFRGVIPSSATDTYLEVEEVAAGEEVVDDGEVGPDFV